jgi:hypothetical protein
MRLAATCALALASLLRLGEAAAACDFEKKGTEVDRLYTATFGLKLATPEMDRVAQIIQEAQVSLYNGQIEEGCILYDKAYDAMAPKPLPY